jgi:hypothetical protein
MILFLPGCQVTEAVGSPTDQVVMMKGAPEVVLSKCSHFYYVSVRECD